MNLKNLLDSKTITLDEYLKIDSGVFVIPFTQRKYEWGKAEVTRLFNDLVALNEGGSDEIHALNFFTFSNEDDELKIYDGQQRTITCLLLLAVIGQKLYQHGDNDLAKQLSTDFFKKIDHRHKNNDVRKLVFYSDKDNDWFYKITKIDYKIDDNWFKNKASNYQKNDNRKSIATNFNLLNTLFNDYLVKHKDVSISNLVNTILEKCILIKLTADTESIATNMFESLNNTGKDLEKYYVLKNNIDKTLNSDDERSKWSEMDSNLMDYSPDKFLIAFSTILSGKTTNSNVLDHIYSKYNQTNKDDMQKLLDLLRDASKKYLYICNPNQLINNSIDQKDIRKFRFLSEYISTFNVKQHFPIILSLLMKNISISEINRILQVILLFIVRNIYFGEIKANSYENDFAQYANKIYEEKMTVNELISTIQKKIIEDTLFKDNIIKKVNKNNNQAKTILRIIYGDEFKSNEVDISNYKIDLEHILPQKPKDKSIWIQNFPDPDEREKYTLNIGNLTLWVSSKNRKAQNSEFEIKKIDYENSSISDNKTIAKNTKWTKKEIDNRAIHLSNKILRHFSVGNI